MNTDDERRVYELGYHMVPTLTEAELQENVDALRKAISELKGNFLSESEPALMELAYTMYINEGGKNTGYDTAFFGWIKFDLDPEQLSHLQDEVLAENKNIIRHLLIKTVAEDTRAQINLEELREVKNDEVITPAKKEEKPEEEPAQASKEDLDETIDKLLEE
jgi:ribosomal protein S6